MPGKGPVTSAVLSVLCITLAIISTVFVCRALNADNWSRQTYYSGAGSSVEIYNKPYCSATRSPFYRCDDFPTIQDDSCVQTGCNRYQPFGVDRTSCKTPAEMTQDATNTGTFQECQAVRYAGNLQIAATAFIAFSLLLLIPMVLMNVAFSLTSSISDSSAGSHHSRSDHHADDKQASERIAPTPATGSSRTHRLHYQLSPYTPFMSLLLLFCLVAGALLQILAQYFGVLGLVLLATPVPATISENVVNAMILNASGWVIDRGLSIWPTVAWTSALASAGIVAVVFKTPRIRRYI